MCNPSAGELDRDKFLELSDQSALINWLTPGLTERFCPPPNTMRASKMALRIKELAAKSDALRLIPETYVVERENQLPINYPRTSTHMLPHANHIYK